MNKKGIGTLLLIVIGLVVGLGALFLVDVLFLSKYSEEEAIATENEVVESEGVGDVSSAGNASDLGDAMNASTNETEMNETDVVNITFADLVPSELNLTEGDCTKVANVSVSCDIIIEAKIRNIGTRIIDENFVVHLYDATDGFEFLEAFLVTDDIPVGGEKSFSYTYEDAPVGKRFIRLLVDAIIDVEESDETNNGMYKHIKIS